MSTFDPYKHARDLAELGCFVFRLKPGGKTPAAKGWQAEATRDPETIRKLFEGTAFNIGVFTEKFRDTEALLCIDVDVKNGVDGNASLTRLELDGVEFPETLEIGTPSGGRHLYYVVSKPVASSVGKLAPGLDVRSAGAYVVGPGSVIDGRAL